MQSFDFAKAKIESFIFDMDGVLWHGERPLPAFRELFSFLDEKGIGYVFATNNANKTLEQYVQKFSRLGVKIKEEMVLTSAEITASYIQNTYDQSSNIFVVGGDGLKLGLKNRGFNVLIADTLDIKSNLPDVAAVVVGFNQEVCYKDFALATLLINNGADFIGANPDPSFPSEYGRLPGAGALIALVQTATDTPPQIMGKPFAPMFEEAVRRLGGGKSTIAMIGDRLTTDIVGAQNAGLRTILVLSGVIGKEDLAQSEIKPDFVLSGIAELLERMSNE